MASFDQDFGIQFCGLCADCKHLKILEIFRIPKKLVEEFRRRLPCRRPFGGCTLSEPGIFLKDLGGWRELARVFYSDVASHIEAHR